MNEGFMRRAIEIARASLNEPGSLPYGAVVVKDGKIIGEGLNRSRSLCDPTSHGEVEAIRDACKRLGGVSLAGCDLYTSCEPCSMCVATMYLANIERLYYASALEDSIAFFARLIQIDPEWSRRLEPDELRQEVGLPVVERMMPAQQVLQDEANLIFDDFVKKES